MIIYVDIDGTICGPADGNLNYNYSKPPHCGVLFYRRYRLFSWHPRVDSTHPDEISSIITSYGERNEF